MREMTKNIINIEKCHEYGKIAIYWVSQIKFSPSICICVDSNDASFLAPKRVTNENAFINPWLPFHETSVATVWASRDSLGTTFFQKLIKHTYTILLILYYYENSTQVLSGDIHFDVIKLI